MENTKKVILIGAGDRGKTYTDIMAKAGNFKVVAVAEPIENRRLYIKNKHGLSEDMCFESWEGLIALGKIADICIVATMDREHTAPAVAAIKAGYDLLLEKPASYSPAECVLIEKTAKEYGKSVLVCHVLRYTPFFLTLKKLIDNGEVGQIINIQHNESVGNVHQSHSFVRGNWGNSDRSSSMILQKCCHDMDILQWLIGKKCAKVQSFGSLTHFTRENMPEGAPDFCIDGCPVGDTCLYNAVDLYINKKIASARAATQKVSPTDEDIKHALRTTNYGRCVYKSDNNVVDHQVVNLEFEDKATVSFSMCAFNRGSRNIRIMGTKGELVANMGEDSVSLYRFSDRKEERISIKDAITNETISGGHGGGDSGIIMALASLGDENSVYKGSVCGISTSIQNHMIAFAAEESRLTGKVVDVREFSEKFYK